MDVLLIDRFWVICVFLSCKSDKTLLEQVDFQGVVTRNKTVNPQIKFESINGIGIRHVLTKDKTGLFLNFLLLGNDFNTFTTTESSWLHYVHIFEVLNFTICLKLSIVIREDISLWAEVVISSPLSFESHNVFPHEIFPTNLM